MQTSPQSIPAQAADYIRTTDGATMREVTPGEFVNLAVLQGWGFKQPLREGETETTRAKWTHHAANLNRL